MISREIFTWLDSPIAKQLKLIYAMPWFSIMANLSSKENSKFCNTLKQLHNLIQLNLIF